MKKLIFIMSLLILSTVVSYIPKAEQLDKKEKVILIDPGHGGMDGGASGKDGTLEKDINLSIAKKLEQELKKLNYKVILTRTSDIELHDEGGTIRHKKREDLQNRNKMIGDTGCDMFISIHLNFFPQTQYYGAQVWYADNKKSENCGNLMQDVLKEMIDKNNNRKAKNAGDKYIILKNPKDIPEIIVECGFLSNEAEREKLKSDQYQQKIASTICHGAERYFSNE